MSAFQRRVLYAVWEHWRNYGEAPSVKQLRVALQSSDTTIYNELIDLSKMGWVEVDRQVSGSIEMLSPRTTNKAEAVIPRIRELL